ncbi:MAG: hypothetical protein WKG00_04790 [Polyangiaceae bacterium]
MIPSDAVAVAAAWGVARLGDRKAEPLLVRLLASSARRARAGGARPGADARQEHAAALALMARSPEAGPPRAPRPSTRSASSAPAGRTTWRC